MLSPMNYCGRAYSSFVVADAQKSFDMTRAKFVFVTDAMGVGSEWEKQYFHLIDAYLLINGERHMISGFTTTQTNDLFCRARQALASGERFEVSTAASTSAAILLTLEAALRDADEVRAC